MTIDGRPFIALLIGTSFIVPLEDTDTDKLIADLTRENNQLRASITQYRSSRNDG